ncbi:hypothetical protein [Corynebacterium sp.]|uniref:hypothetical protein n=1 Tax=Corynebacterium sp. TaxID=1720 RepID=UPI0026DDB029|nr:hypothetical protein [Corynebacterium sp.]MDO5031257.1 hypothetical protein [Corynebacterium sp.]
MSKVAQFITTVVIGGFAVFLALLIALTQFRDKPLMESTVAATLEKYPDNLQFAVLVPQDVYGDRWMQGLVVCPGTTEQDLKESGLDPMGVDFVDGKVPEGAGYYLAVDQFGSAAAEKMDPQSIDMCGVLAEYIPEGKPDVYPVQPGQPLQFQRVGDAWQFVG